MVTSDDIFWLEILLGQSAMIDVFLFETTDINSTLLSSSQVSFVTRTTTYFNPLITNRNQRFSKHSPNLQSGNKQPHVQ